jgi:hypothetical protein
MIRVTIIRTKTARNDTHKEKEREREREKRTIPIQDTNRVSCQSDGDRKFLLKSYAALSGSVPEKKEKEKKKTRSIGEVSGSRCDLSDLRSLRGIGSKISRRFSRERTRIRAFLLYHLRFLALPRNATALYAVCAVKSKRVTVMSIEGITGAGTGRLLHA